MLLSCSDMGSAQNLANKLGGSSKVMAWEGRVSIFENGAIRGEGLCREFSAGNAGRTLSAAEVPKGSAAAASGEKVTLGVKGAESTLGSIVKVGNKIEYTNPAGKLLKWSEQTANDITNSINAAKTSTDVGRKLEGTVADFIKREGKTVEGFGLKINNANNQAITDLDILTQNEIVEVKNSFSSWSNKPDQVNRFVNSALDDFVNPYNKKAILYIETPLTQVQKTTILTTIPSNVTLVNSLNELKTVLQ